jgi:hypothetical protein
VQVGLITVAGPDVGHDLVVLVHQDVLADAVTAHRVALVERQHGLAVVGDAFEVLDVLGVHRVIPDQVARVVEDGGPVAPAPAALGGDEHVPRGDAARG